MPQLTQPFETFERPGLVVSYRLANVKIFKGALVGTNAAGFLVPMNPATANLKFAGIANETVDNSAGSNGDRVVNVTKSGAFTYRAATGFTPTVADLGKEVYAASDWEIQVASAGLTNAYKVGTIVALEAPSNGGSGCRVRIDNHNV